MPNPTRSVSPGYGTSPTTSEVEYTAEELTVLRAAEQYKKRMRRRFLTVTDTMRIMLALGYRRDPAHISPGIAEDRGEQVEVACITKAKRNGVSWEEVVERLRLLHSQGSPWLGYNRLAKQWGCSSQRVYLAVERTPELHAWANYGIRKAEPVEVDEAIERGTARAERGVPVGGEGGVAVMT
jgi:hypothetical protein